MLLEGVYEYEALAAGWTPLVSDFQKVVTKMVHQTKGFRRPIKRSRGLLVGNSAPLGVALAVS